MNKNILLGITGGIAAYKMAEVASRLTKLGNNVQVVMTEAATKFITPLTFQNLTHNPVEYDLFSPPEHYNVKHISLADAADIVLIAPATANFIGKIAAGLADDLLSTLIMATQAPIMIAPSMNVHMYENGIFRDNLTYLKEKGYSIIEPNSGQLACGYQGKGRLPEPVELIDQIIFTLKGDKLARKKILITAGPTREAIDPVRYISNYSSGKMGYSLARAACLQGAEVILVSGPVEDNIKQLILPDIELISVESAREMEREIKKYAAKQDIIMAAAAVADFRPEEIQKNKIKKNEMQDLVLKLKANPDILAGIGMNKRPGQILVGFALESHNLMKNAREKMKKKNLDMIIANEISALAVDDNQVTIITTSNEEKLAKMDKLQLAEEIVARIAKFV